MNKGKAARLLGFVGALGLSTALVTTAVQGTGAYFTSSFDGSFTGKTGQLTVALSAGSSATLSFDDLVPGEKEGEKVVSYDITAGSSTNADVWLVFNPNSENYGRFTGQRNDRNSDPHFGESLYGGFSGGGMGEYGHFKVVGQQANHLFESYNLQLKDANYAMTWTSNGYANGACIVDKNGNGGSAVQHTIGGGHDIPECGVPAAILLRTNVAPGKTGTATITFGVTGKATNQGDAQPTWSVPFKIVATQVGQYPLIETGTNAGTVGSTW